MTSDGGIAGSVGDLADRIQTPVGRQPTSAALVALDDVAAAVSPIGVADGLLDQVRQRDLPLERLRQLGLWLAENGTRRGAVAVGIILLGLAGDIRDRGLLLLLGALEDLTLYAVVALGRCQPDRHQAIFDLARRVDGWGRIHAVNRLAGTDDPEIKAWLLREGRKRTSTRNHDRPCRALPPGLTSPRPSPVRRSRRVLLQGDIEGLPGSRPWQPPPSLPPPAPSTGVDVLSGRFPRAAGGARSAVAGRTGTINWYA